MLSNKKFLPVVGQSLIAFKSSYDLRSIYDKNDAWL